MSLARRWFDPIRSRWFFNRRYRQRHLPSHEGLTVYLRFDDVYSCLVVQMLARLEDLLVDSLKPIQIVISDTAETPPNNLSREAWQQYTIGDAAVLASQHRFTFDPKNSCPPSELIQQAKEVLLASPLAGHDYLHLLQDVFLMLWQNQAGKLKTLHYMATTRAKQHHTAPIEHPLRFDSEPVLSAHLMFGGRKYRAIDDFLRLTRRLKRQRLLVGEPIFLINHIEWGEHLINDPASLSEVQALQAELDMYVTLEDPVTWLIVSYIKRELVDYYNITLRVHPLPYQQRDQFDWGMAMRLSRRAEVRLSPFCRPTQRATEIMAQRLYAIEEEYRAEALLSFLQDCWTRGLDPEYPPHLQRMLQHYPDYRDKHIDLPETLAWLQDNQDVCSELEQPDLPVMVLKIGEETHVFNSLYRVWQIENLMAASLSYEHQ